MQENKISLRAAVLINVNIMLGVGIFINTIALPKLAGILGFLSYLTVGILMLPLILSMAKLVSVVPAGGFYAYGKTFLNPFAGFVSSWSYFWAKLASCTLMVHTFAKLLCTFVPAMKAIPILLIDCSVVALFVILNTLNLKTNTRIQTILFVFKVIPILFVIFGGLALYNSAHITLDDAMWTGFPATLALVLYAFSGFEASCALSSSIENPEKNASKAILISYSIVVCTCLLYQFISFAAIGPDLSSLPYFSALYGKMIASLFAKLATIAPYVKILMYSAMASSSLGGAYGIMFSNNWNMFQLAKGNHIVGSKYLRIFNKNKIPFLCVLLEGLICLAYIFITKGDQLPLQQMGAFGCIIAYTISVIALAKGILKNKVHFNKLICGLAIGNCLILAISTIQSFIATANALALVLFLSIITLGIATFIYTRQNNEE